jgi:DNA replication protein DnaC
MTTSDLTPEELRARLRKLGLHGLFAQWDELAEQPWLRQVIAIEEAERQRRSLARRIGDSRLGTFKPLADFDWSWPRQIDRQAIDELFGLGFLADGTNVILVGPNGVGKTMLLKNLAYHAILRGHTVRLISASDMLADLAAQDSSAALARRLRRYNLPQLLCVDEVGYLSYSNRYADLLFEVVTRRYDANKPILLSTNKAFNDWAEVFPHAACTVTLVDRLVHRSEILEIDGDSYRLKEAKERQLKRSSSRRIKKPKP